MTEFFNILLERPDRLIEWFVEQAPKVLLGVFMLYGLLHICYVWLSLFKGMFTDLFKDILALFHQ